MTDVAPRALWLRTATPQDTAAVGEALAPLLRAGDAVALSGELGAGKTVFVQGVARGLGITDRVTSPTFTLVRSYLGGRLPLVHCDVYRLDRLHDVLDLGDEVLAPDVVTLIEWGDAIAPLLPADRLEAELVHDGAPGGTVDEDGVVPAAPRRVRLRLCGGFEARADQLRRAFAPWRTDDVGRHLDHREEGRDR